MVLPCYEHEHTHTHTCTHPALAPALAAHVGQVCLARRPGPGQSMPRSCFCWASWAISCVALLPPSALSLPPAMFPCPVLLASLCASASESATVLQARGLWCCVVQRRGGGRRLGGVRHAAAAARHGSPAHLNAASDSSCGRGGVPGLLCRGVLAVHDAAVGAALHRAVGPAAAGCLLHAPPPVQGPGLRESFATMSPLLAPRVTVKRLA